jgi:hypothetical protein
VFALDFHMICKELRSRRKGGDFNGGFSRVPNMP